MRRNLPASGSRAAGIGVLGASRARAALLVASHVISTAALRVLHPRTALLG